MNWKRKKIKSKIIHLINLVLLHRLTRFFRSNTSRTDFLKKSNFLVKFQFIRQYILIKSNSPLRKTKMIARRVSELCKLNSIKVYQAPNREVILESNVTSEGDQTAKNIFSVISDESIVAQITLLTQMGFSGHWVIAKYTFSVLVNQL